MNDRTYQVLGVGIPPMLGRGRLFEELCRHLTKPTPDHMCVTGPRFFGKSVLLNHLASHFKDAGDHYAISLYWDLRHGTPMTDADFRRQFAERIKAALEPAQPELAEYLELEEEGLGDLLQLVFDDMESKGLRLLAVLDGFDHVLAGSGITKNLWDEMRALGEKASLRFVTGSRRRLRELCMTEESRTSDFWEIFYDSPLEIGCFEDRDWSGFLDPFELHGVTLDSSARKEIANWTGGVPILAAGLAGRLRDGSPGGTSLSKPQVDDVADETSEEKRDLLAALWDDCPIELRSDLVELSKGEMPLSEVPDQRRRDLELRGFARSSGNKLRSSCRLMDRYARQQADEVGNLRRLFGEAERFEGNIGSLLELRLAQVEGADPELVGCVERAIRDLLPEPAHSVVWARSIAERALDLIWDAELATGTNLPKDWESVGVNFEGGRIPRGRARQCRILRLITGTGKHAPVSKFVTKPTSLLLDHLHSVGNFGQHRGQNTVTVPMAASFCLSAISLCESLAKDLAAPGDA